MNELHPYAIVEIQVKGLFGYIDQKLQPTKKNRDKVSQLAILYGENGTGKTTLLRLAFHLLSPRVDRGHKSGLARTPFKFLSITLYDGTRLQAERDKARSGDYTFSVKRPRKKALTFSFKTERGGTRIAPYAFNKDLQQALTDCASTIIFLRDDRLIEVESNFEASNPWEEVSSEVSTVTRGRKIIRHEEQLLRMQEEPDQLGAALRMSIERLDRWFSVQYGQRTSTGMASSHAIYEQVIARVSSANEPQRRLRSLNSIIKDLIQVSEESTVFETYGLSSPMNVDPIIHSLKNADTQQMRTLHSLLAPYIDTVKARFAELREIYETIDTFISQSNRFMKSKRITYRVGEGLRIYSPRNQRLSPTELSSGERHLLLILSSAVLARSHRTIFIIDEPEISLNTTWQRDLAGALLAVSKNSVNQFILASHSLPLITPYRDHVLRLKEEEDQES